MRKVFLDDLPKWKQGTCTGSIKWGDSLNYEIKFVYDEIEDWIKIIKYEIKNQMLTVKYNEKEYKIKTMNFQNCHFGKILEKRTCKFKIDIGTRFKDEKRDITVIDREYRENPYNKGKFLKYYKYKCNVCGWTEGWIDEGNLKKKTGCSCCCGRITVEGINDIPTTAPWMIPYFQGGYDEAKLYTKNGGGNPNNRGGKIFAICQDCGRIKDKKINIYNIYNRHHVGCSCSDKISYGEKFMFNILEQTGIDFQTQLNKTTFKWCLNFKYDFYFKLNDEQYICEVNGLQHYEENSKHSKFKRTLLEEQENDELKKLLALSNGIKEENYIVIDCRKSELDWIKQNILNSKLSELFDLKSIDWNKAEEFTLSNLIKIICKYKKENPQLSTTEIGLLKHINRGVVKEYLKKGSQVNWCEYNAKEEYLKGVRKNKGAKKVICLNNEVVFMSASSCAEQSLKIFNIRLFQSNISQVCAKRRKSHKGYTFKYIEDLTPEEYIKYDIENKLKELHSQDLVQAI